MCSTPRLDWRSTSRSLYLSDLLFMCCVSVSLLYACDGDQPSGVEGPAGAMGGVMGGALGGEGGVAGAGSSAGMYGGGAQAGGSEGDPDLEPHQVLTRQGVLEGVTEETSYGETLTFKGIPYATPPIGPLRLRAPQPPLGWEGVYRADHFGASCPQRGLLTDRSAEQDEDCLTLNVWRPVEENREGSREGVGLPVMVWVHGGGFLQGSGSASLYNGARLARRGEVIVVTLNYRLGVLGFLNTRRLEGEGLDQANFGLQDQLMALTWVQENIARFGGDPTNVTLFGESAGGFSVCALLASPQAEGLFSKAIIQSGGGCNGLSALEEPLNTASTLERRAEAIIQAIGCVSDSGEAMTGGSLRSCLEEAPVEVFLDASVASGKSLLGLDQLGPSQDGHLIIGRADQMIKEGQRPSLPVIIGSNSAEMSLFTLTVPVTLAGYESLVQEHAGPHVERILERYPATDDASAKEAFQALFGDLIFNCPTLSFAEAFEATEHPAWVYYFDHALTSGLPATLGATHALEVPFVFNNYLQPLYGADFSATDAQLSDQLTDLWASFAHEGAPSVVGIEWPAYRTGSVAHLRAPTEVLNEPLRGGRCAELAELELITHFLF